MKVKVFSKYYILNWVGFLLILSSCAPERKGIVANVYHNTTARYNAYFYAKLHMDEIQQAVMESQENNFNKILAIFPKTDTSLINSLNTKIEDCIKKASVAIERHPNSHWADDSYILIGQCRLYNQNFSDAIETFKYVNTQSKDNSARHLALIKLMRTFIEAREYNNAVAVSDYLKKEKLNRGNKVQLHITKAYLYQLNGDYSNVISNLSVAAPLMKNDEGKARIYYIIGQIYQELGFDAQAYDNYEQVLKSNPEYELYFYARLNMAQVYDLSKERDTKKIRKYFRKLLKDKKNLEYKDKIYYEMAAFERKQGNLDEAIDLYKQSVLASINNSRQKAYGYLALGRIYYDTSRYELAKAYYDSTISVLPEDELEYEQIAQRQKVLANFVEQLNIIEEQDSLLALAAMDSVELDAFLDDVLREQEREKQEQEIVEKRQTRRSRNANFPDVQSPFDAQNQARASNSEGSWYFYSPAAISMGRTAFVRRWGNRPLQDNWRRGNKDISATFAKDNVDTIQATENLASEEMQSSGRRSPEELAGAQKQMFYADIPFTEEQQQQALAQIEGAYYKLGGIYDFDLNEKQNAVETFETLLSRFPSSEYKPEVLYQLYLIYKELSDDTYIKYKNQLLKEFPESIYAKIIENPNYRQESKLASEKMKQIYKEAYTLYEKGEYAKAEQIVSASLLENPDNNFADNMALLRVLITGKRENAAQYQLALQNFLVKYPESELQEYATTLLESVRNFDSKEAASKGAQYIPEFDEKHSFIILYKNNKNLSSTLPKVIEAFNKQYFPDQKLTTANLMLENGRVMIIVEDFADMNTAKSYYSKFNSEVSPLNNLPSEEAKENVNENFVITEDNLNILYKTKDIENYLRFFEKNYM